MSGSTRDLAVVDHWNASLQRSLERRARAGRGFARRRPQAARADRPDRHRASWTIRGTSPKASPGSFARALTRSPPGRRAAVRARQLAGQARLARGARGLQRLARRRDRQRAGAARRRGARLRSRPRPPSTRSCSAPAAKGRQVRLLQAASGRSKWTAIFGPETEAACATSRPTADCSGRRGRLMTGRLSAGGDGTPSPAKSRPSFRSNPRATATAAAASR